MGASAVRFNTFVSYAFRVLAIGQMVSFWALSKGAPINMSSAEKLASASRVATIIIAALLILDWTTRKDPARKFAKLIDTVLGMVWLLVVGAVIVYSLSMGTL